MNDEPIEITYQFACSGRPRRKASFRITLDPESLESHAAVANPPEWAHLNVQQCKVCPLKPDVTPLCPAALSLVELVEEFRDLLSFTEVETTVITIERTVHLHTTMQKALSSLIGLAMATSGCPILAKFKPMARFHLPFSTREETVFRSASTYLLAQYFLKRRGAIADLDLAGLREIYTSIHQVNKGLAARLRTIPAGDAHLNAIVMLDLFAHALPVSIEENLVEIEHMFQPYLADFPTSQQ